MYYCYCRQKLPRAAPEYESGYGRVDKMVNLVIILECLGTCLIFVALILLLNGDGAREQKLLIFIMCG